MKTFVQRGESLTVTAPYAVTSGQGVLVGALFGIAAFDGAQNATIEAQTQGVFDITKQPALAITAGARVFWDDTNRRITTTATSNFQVGIATQAALAADTTVRVWLNRVPPSGS
jgi:predicted RecA/RadA family phage recombinase